MLETIYQDVLAGRVAEVAAGVQRALEAGYAPGKILSTALIAAMADIGRRFEAHECFVPEMLVAAYAMKAGLKVLRPHLVQAHVEPVGQVVLGTVQGDLHDIGKNLVGMMLEGAGFHVIDLGVNVPPAKFVEAVRAHHPVLLGMSALLTTTLNAMRLTLNLLKTEGLRGEIKVMVGGAPVTQQFADEIGADLYAPDAASAASRATDLVKAAVAPANVDHQAGQLGSQKE